MSLPILYSFRRCPYAMRARLALDVAGIALEHREILLKDKPPQMLEASPKGTVPVLVLSDGRVLEESLDVMHWALEQNDPEGWLDLDEEAKALIAQNDGPFKRALDRYKYPNRYENADPLAERASALAMLEGLEARLEAKGWLSGQQPGFADFAIAPFIRQFAHTDKDWFDAQPLPKLQAWLETILTSPRFVRIMSKHALWDYASA